MEEGFVTKDGFDKYLRSGIDFEDSVNRDMTGNKPEECHFAVILLKGNPAEGMIPRMNIESKNNFLKFLTVTASL